MNLSEYLRIFLREQKANFGGLNGPNLLLLFAAKRGSNLNHHRQTAAPPTFALLDNSTMRPPEAAREGRKKKIWYFVHHRGRGEDQTSRTNKVRTKQTAVNIPEGSRYATFQHFWNPQKVDIKDMDTSRQQKAAIKGAATIRRRRKRRESEKARRSTEEQQPTAYTFWHQPDGTTNDSSHHDARQYLWEKRQLSVKNEAKQTRRKDHIGGGKPLRGKHDSRQQTKCSPDRRTARGGTFDTSCRPLLSAPVVPSGTTANLLGNKYFISKYRKPTLFAL
jgi:hypothetical protein